MSSSCRRWCRASDLRTTSPCECIVTAEAQWKELFRARYPTSEPPTLSKVDGQEGIDCDDYCSSFAALPSIEEQDSGSSGVTIDPSGGFTPSSSDILVSGSVRRLICHLQQKVTELEMRTANMDRGRSDLTAENEGLTHQIRKLEQSNQALHGQVRTMKNLIGLVWAAFEDRTEPQSRLGLNLKRSVMEAVPSVFDSSNTTMDGPIESLVNGSAPSQGLPCYETHEERGHAVALQIDANPFGMPSEFEELLSSGMQGSSTESTSFDDWLLDSSLGD